MQHAGDQRLVGNAFLFDEWYQASKGQANLAQLNELLKKKLDS